MQRDENQENPARDQSEQRGCLLDQFDQPLTVNQLARRAGLDEDACGKRVARLRRRNLLRCLNPEAMRNRLYVPVGFQSTNLAEIDWSLYGLLCYRQRWAVVTAMDSTPMQCVQIRRRARYLNPDLKMTSNNARDVLRFLCERGVIRRSGNRRNHFPLFELTLMGGRFRELLLQAAGPPAGTSTEHKSPRRVGTTRC